MSADRPAGGPGRLPPTVGQAAAAARPADHAGLSSAARLGIILSLTLVAVAAFYLVGASGSWDFVIPFRSRRLAALAVVGVAIAVSTVLFQTVTENRILTPSIMGFDSLYALLQTVLLFGLGSIALNQVPVTTRFALELVLMLTFSFILFRWLFGGARRSLYLLVLVGIVFGVLFRSLATFMQRIIDPNEYLVLQDRLFASFNAVDPTLLGVCAVIVAVVSIPVWRRRRVLDVLTLGRDNAIALGVDHRREVLAVLAIVAVLVSVSTALVGPITFFGLLVANLAYQVMGTHRHEVVLPAAALLGVLTLVGGQVVLEHVFGLDTVLSVIIEFLGGIVFILLLVRGGRR